MQQTDLDVMMNARTTDKLYSIQLLRFISATLVVIFHANLALNSRFFSVEAGPNAYWFGFGAVGVHIFFVISGYIMVLTSVTASEPYNAPQFLLKRCIRIYPAYWLLLLCYLAYHAWLGDGIDVSAYSLLSALLLLPDYASLIIGPAWTLSYELYFYLAFGLAMTLGLRRGMSLLSVFFVLAMSVGIIAKPANAFLSLATNSLLLEFLFGVWIALLTQRKRISRPFGLLCLTLALLLFAAGLVFGYDRAPSAVIWGMPSALLVLGAVVIEQNGSVSRIRRASVLGDSSYILYLAHILMITLFVALFKWANMSSVPAWLLTAIVTICAVAGSHILHQTIEAPMLRQLTQWRKRYYPAMGRTAAA